MDVVVEVMELSEYYAVERRLEALGFRHDLSEDAPMCRWKIGDILLDVLSSHEGVLPFWNRWHLDAIENFTDFELPTGLSIRLARAPTFIASKFTAFEDRGKGDYLASHDIEDILAVIDGRPSLATEFASTEKELKDYVVEQLRAMKEGNVYNEMIAGFYFSESVGDVRAPNLKARIDSLIGLR